MYFEGSAVVLVAEKKKGQANGIRNYAMGCFTH